MGSSESARGAGPKYQLGDMEHFIGYNERVYTLRRLRALRDFGDVRAGDLGGWIENESNLAQEGSCWVYDEAKVYNLATVHGDVQVRCEAQVAGGVALSGRLVIGGKTLIRNGGTIVGL